MTAAELFSAGAGTLTVQKKTESDRVVALAGNPNVGKSTIFNALTGLRQHTGNWPGKTVSNAQGYCRRQEQGYVLVDVPGCYSLRARSAEEEAARDFICFGEPDAVIVVCDASCLERNLNLVLQVMEATPRVAVSVNLMDEAEKRGIRVDLEKLSELLEVPVTGTAARSGAGLDGLMEALQGLFEQPVQRQSPPVSYPDYLEQALQALIPALEQHCTEPLRARWLALQLLSGSPPESLRLQKDPLISLTLRRTQEMIRKAGISPGQLRDDLAAAPVRRAAALCRETVSFRQTSSDRRDRMLDRLFTSRVTGFPIMLLMLLGIFWLTITGANYPSELLGKALFRLEELLAAAMEALHVPPWLTGLLIHGGYRVVAWVVSVMLPPMAIFFPLFTLLEDFGYLPRVAFNLDRCFQCCRACGKQSLTMMMGLGCNAAGVTGCRIIDSPRERLIAILTNSFVPCNGRFPPPLKGKPEGSLPRFFPVGAGRHTQAAAEQPGKVLRSQSHRLRRPGHGAALIHQQAGLLQPQSGQIPVGRGAGARLEQGGKIAPLQPHVRRQLPHSQRLVIPGLHDANRLFDHAVPIHGGLSPAEQLAENGVHAGAAPEIRPGVTFLPHLKQLLQLTGDQLKSPGRRKRRVRADARHRQILTRPQAVHGAPIAPPGRHWIGGVHNGIAGQQDVAVPRLHREHPAVDLHRSQPFGAALDDVDVPDDRAVAGSRLQVIIAPGGGDHHFPGGAVLPIFCKHLSSNKQKDDFFKRLSVALRPLYHYNIDKSKANRKG